MMKNLFQNFRIFSLVFLSNLLILFVVPNKVWAQGKAGVDFEILFLSNVNGMIQNCHCGSPALGGLGRLASVVQKKRHSNPHLLFIDGGDFLNPYSYPLLNKSILAIYQTMKPDIIQLGEQDYCEGKSFLTAWPYLATHCLATNYQADGVPSRRFEKIKKREQQSVVILAYLDRSSFAYALSSEKYFNFDEDLFQKMYNKFSKDSYLVVIFHGSGPALTKFTLKFPAIRLVLFAHEQCEQSPSNTSPAIICGGSDARFLNDICLKWSPQTKSYSVSVERILIREEMAQDRRIQPIINEFNTKNRKNEKEN